MELIDKSAIVAEIEKKIANIKEYCLREGHDVKFDVVPEQLSHILSFINTLGVKYVDLDFQTFAKEMDAVFNLPSTETTNTEEDPFNWEYAIAKHFFNLGLKAKEGKK